MKKIIAAFDGLKYSAGTRDHAIYLAKASGAHLVGVFLDDPTYSSYKIYELVGKEGVSEKKLKELDQKDKELRAKAAADFDAVCRRQGLQFSLHHDHHIAIHDLKHESVYADMLVIDGTETLTHYKEKLPTRFIRDLLTDVQCPVLVTPPKFSAIENVMLLYDGEPSSVHAIKMFSYLLPQLKELETEVISVNPVATTLHMPDNKLMKEFMKRHFPKAKYTVLKGYPEYEIVKHLNDAHSNTLVVMGANRRGMVSRWFRESMADVLMKTIKLPLFIAHK